MGRYGFVLLLSSSAKGLGGEMVGRRRLVECEIS